MVFISNLEANLTDSAVAVLKYMDDSKVVADVVDKVGVANTQESLDIVYQWAETNNMRWNKNKFQRLRLGNNNNLKLDTVYFSFGMKGIVEVKEQVKNLGIYIDENLFYKYQR